MPPRRSTRASSAEDGGQAPTRTSRRLRGRQDPNDSPLRSLEAPSRRKRIASTTTTDSSRFIYTDTTITRKEDKSNPTIEKEQKSDEQTAAGISDTDVLLRHVLARDQALSARIHRPLSFAENLAIVTFDNANDLFTSFDITCNSNIHAALRKQAEFMTNQKLIDLAIRHVGTISALRHDIHKSADVAQLASQERDEAREQLQEAQEEIRELQEQLQEKERRTSLKRPASTEDEEANADQERPTRRLKLTPTSAKSVIPKSITPSKHQSLSSPLAMAGTARRSPHRAGVEVDNEDEEGEDEEEDISFFVTHVNRSSPAEPSKYQTFVAQRMREKERLKKEHEWLGNQLTDPDLPLPGESDEEENMPSDQDDDLNRANSSMTQSPRKNDVSNASKSTSLTPIREQSEPATPPTRRWGLTSILAPVTRLFGGTPRTEPARRSGGHSNSGTLAPGSTPSGRHLQSDVTPTITSSSQRSNSSQDGPETTPLTPNHGITAASFLPQSAPQPRRGATEPIKRRRSHAERIKAYDAGVAKRKLAEEKARQAEERARQKAIEEEDVRLRAEARELRKKTIEEMQNPGEKRKIRVDDLEVIPNPVKSGYGMDEKYFEEDSDGEVYVDEDASKSDALTPPATKRVRFDSPSSVGTSTKERTRMSDVAGQKKPWWQSDVENFNKVSPHKAMPGAALSGDPQHVRPYTGKTFADVTENVAVLGANIFEQTQAGHTYKEKEPITTSPRTPKSATINKNVQKSPQKNRSNSFNWEGHFTVPDDSEIDSEFGGSDKTELSTDAPRSISKNSNASKSSANVEEQNSNSHFTKQINHGGETKLEKTNSGETPLTPPPPPTPAHAALPGTSGAVPQPNDFDALAKARSQAEKYKPKTPSGLRATSRLSSSPVFPNSGRSGGNSNIFAAAAAADSNAMPPNIQITDTPSFSPTTDAGYAVKTYNSNQDQTGIPGSHSSSLPAALAYVPYEQTLQYAIEIANTVPLDKLPQYEFALPSTKSLPWPLDPQVENALKEAEQHPDWTAFCDESWMKTYSAYLTERADGKHVGVIRSVSTPVNSLLKV